MAEEINAGVATAELLKELVDEVRHLRNRVEQLESQNSSLLKAVDDPETMMKKAGWLKAVTPLAEEVYDPLQRGGGDESFPSGFSSEQIQKSHSQNLAEWQEMENNMPSSNTPSGISYR